MNTPLNYMQLANRTNKDGELIEINEKLTNALITAMPNMIFAASQADRLKASLVYGEKLRDKGIFASENISENSTPKDREMLHAMLGVFSEAGEIVEAFYYSMINGEPLDEKNLVEELGDLMWFIALFARNLDTDLGTIANKNIEKLKIRYPDKFTEEQAIYRDLQGERDAFES